MTKLLTLAFAFTLLAASGVGAQPLGRLFFTPAERAELDLARVRTRQPAPPVPTSEPPAISKPLPVRIAYGGVVRRSDGRSMLWINGRLVDEQDALAKLDLQGRVSPDGSVELQVAETDGHVRVKVGQSVEVPGRRVAERSLPKAGPGNRQEAGDTSLDEDHARPGAQQPARRLEPKHRVQAGTR